MPEEKYERRIVKNTRLLNIIKSLNEPLYKTLSLRLIVDENILENIEIIGEHFIEMEIEYLIKYGGTTLKSLTKIFEEHLDFIHYSDQGNMYYKVLNETNNIETAKMVAESAWEIHINTALEYLDMEIEELEKQGLNDEALYVYVHKETKKKLKKDGYTTFFEENEEGNYGEYGEYIEIEGREIAHKKYKKIHMEFGELVEFYNEELLETLKSQEFFETSILDEIEEDMKEFKEEEVIYFIKNAKSSIEGLKEIYIEYKAFLNTLNDDKLTFYLAILDETKDVKKAMEKMLK